MADLLQCPNCGGYRISEEVSAIDATTGKTWTESMIAEMKNDADSSMIWGVITFVFTIGIFLIIMAIISYNKVSTGKRVLQEGLKTHSYTCYICNFRWEWREDQPYEPLKNTSSQDKNKLLQMGEQRLQEEEEQFRYMGGLYMSEQRRLEREGN